MGQFNKLEFMSKYGTDKHREGLDAKVDHIVKNLPEHNVDETEEDSFKDSRLDFAYSKLIKGHHLDHLIKHPDPVVRKSAAGHPSIEHHHVEHLMANGDHEVYHSLIHNRHVKLSPDHIHKILDYTPPGGIRYHPAATIAYRHSLGMVKLNDEHWDKIARNPANIAINSIQHMPMKHLLTTALEHPDTQVQGMAMRERRNRIAAGEKD